jgi:transposase
LLGRLDEVPESVQQMLSFNRDTLDIFEKTQKRIIKDLQKETLIQKRVQRLMTIPGVGEILALTWALEIGDPQRFSSVRKAISYCGLCSAEKESAGKSKRGPISSQRNKHIQWVLIEAAKVAPRRNPHLAGIHAREMARGNRNRATLAVARKLAAYLLAVDKSGKVFAERDQREVPLPSPLKGGSRL